jgi:ABC-type branched-subunit amino acid transport system substrate-binding protein
VANADFLRVGGKDVEGTLLPAGPVLVADQLPASHPVKKSAQAYVQKYEAAYGKGSVSTFGAHAWDAGLLLTAAVPVALKKAQPGTPGVPCRAARRAGGREGRCRARTASSTCRPATTWAWTSAPG